MKLIYTVFLGIITFSISFSRDAVLEDSTRIRKNSFYFEVFGNAMFYSMNYERDFVAMKDKAQIYTRVGYASLFDGRSAYSFEQGLIFGRKHCFEAGYGITPHRDKSSYTGNVIWYSDKILRTGYRYRGNKGFLLRIGPAILFEHDWGAVPWGGLCIGYSF